MLEVEVCFRGHMDKDWSNRFGGLTIVHTDGDTILRGHLRDQPELRGLLSWLDDLGLELVSLNSDRTHLVTGKEAGQV